jgi:hypothetical protein
VQPLGHGSKYGDPAGKYATPNFWILAIFGGKEGILKKNTQCCVSRSKHIYLLEKEIVGAVFGL